MTTFIIRRLLIIVPTLILISFLIYTILELPPGDYLSVLEAQLEEEGTEYAEARLSRLRERYGLNKPFIVRYWRWISGLMQGDLGESFIYRQPVTDLIGSRITMTVILSSATTIFMVVVAVPFGIIAAVNQYNVIDQVLSVISFIGLATPNFLLALILILVAFYAFGTSPGGLFSPEYADAPWSFAKFLDLLAHLWVPVIVIGTARTAGSFRVMRGEVLDILGKQYVSVARSKGLRETTVIWKHVARLAINPIISGLGMALPRIISGSVIVSIVLGLPTMGPLLFQALKQRDMYLAGSFLVLSTVLLIIGNLIADVTLAWADPRIRYE